MAVVIDATLFPVPEYRDEVIAAIETVQALTPHRAGSTDKGVL